MLGALIASLDDPKAAMALVAAFDEPALLARLAAAADASGRTPADVVGSTVRNFVETASDDLWTQLIGVINRAGDPALAALRAILSQALPEAREAAKMSAPIGERSRLDADVAASNPPGGAPRPTQL